MLFSDGTGPSNILAETDCMKLTILTDNKPSANGLLNCEHGLAIHFAYKGRSFLVDTGATSLFAVNARTLGIDIADVDYLILSHAHADHTGGLRTFLENNSKAKVYLSQSVFGNSFCSTRRGAKRDISPDQSLFEQYSERFVPVVRNMTLCEGVSIISDIKDSYKRPAANATLLRNDAPDDFSHEIFVTADTDSGKVVLSPCSHCGALNIIDSAEGDISHYVGGLHLLDSDGYFVYESDEELYGIAAAIKERNIKLHTGHCTGERAKKIFSQFSEHLFSEFCTGYTLCLD